MNNAYIRPGGVAQDLPPGAIDMVRDTIPRCAAACSELELLLNENPAPQGPHRRRRLPRPHRLHGAGHHRPGAALDRPAARPAQARRPTAATRPTTSRSSPAPSCDAYARLRIRIDEMYESLKIVEQAIDRLQAHPGPPVMVEDKKIAWPAQLAIGGDGMGNSLDHIREIMGTSMESLIHHFKLVTEGFRVPPGQAYAAVESRQGRARLPRRVRRRHPPLPRALPRPVVQQPAGRGGDVRGRPGRRRHRRRGLDRPRHGRCRPLMSHDFGLQHTRPGTSPCRQESKEPYPADVLAQLPRRRRAGHRALPAEALGAAAAAAPRAVASTATSPGRGIDFCAELLDLEHRRGLRRRDVLHAVQAPPQRRPTPSASAPTRSARSWAATRSGTPSPSTSASATTRPPPTARSPSSASSATPPATSPRW